MSKKKPEPYSIAKELDLAFKQNPVAEDDLREWLRGEMEDVRRAVNPETLRRLVEAKRRVWALEQQQREEAEEPDEA